MKYQKTQRVAVSSAFMIAILAVANPSLADSFPFRVAFEDVPGTEEIESGDILPGIEILENQREQVAAESKGHLLATLCGAYIMTLDLDKAASTCDEAVQDLPGETAYNNRGVLRAFTGNFTGATEDFNRARPHRMDEYIEYLKTKDVGLIADGNHSLLQELSARHTPADVNTSVAMSTAVARDVTN